MEFITTLFPGIGTFFAQEPIIAAARLFLIAFGFFLSYMGFTRKLEPLIMVPMGIGMVCVNAGVLFLSDGSIGTLLLDPLVSDPTELMNVLQVNCFQPIYNFMFSNGLIACLVFMGIGARSEISFPFNGKISLEKAKANFEMSITERYPWLVGGGVEWP